MGTREDESPSLKEMAGIINGGIASAQLTGARLERHGDLIVLREGPFVYALGLLDNGEKVYPRGQSGR